MTTLVSGAAGRCQCFRPDRDSRWLFSRYSTGWRCGLHADWTELTACVDEAMDQLERDRRKRRSATGKIPVTVI